MGSINWLLATRNKGKIRELGKLLDPYPVHLKGLDDLGVTGESPETGDSFLDNAKQKAKYYFDRAGVPVVADDSGLEVDALNGAPGIHSARFGGLKQSAEQCRYLLDLMADVPKPWRTARFRCAAIYFDGWQYLSSEASLEGYIGLAPEGSLGFGYDPVFHMDPAGPSLAQIPMTEKNAVSHRGKAFRALVKSVMRVGSLSL